MTISTSAFGLADHIRHCASGGHLQEEEMRQAIGLIMDGQATHAQISALLVALRVNGETTDEVVGASRAMRERALLVPCDRQPLMDVCGTGGDDSGSFNISTAVAFVVAGAGVAVAKHGNRAMSSHCGSADVLEALGVDLEAASLSAQSMLERHGIAFLFAQRHHPAMRVVAPVRREIGIRTLFNLLGPLTNPANITHQVVGVAHANAMPLMSNALRALGRRRAAVVHAEDGMDEVSLASATHVVEWDGSALAQYTIEPEMFGVQRRPASEIAGGTPRENAQLIELVLAGRPGAHRDVVLLNAGLALYIAGSSEDICDGVRVAARSIDSGAARRALQMLMEAGA
jgi:anthranilate phosphoribosyltransferase